jgi:hypothetical protein
MIGASSGRLSEQRREGVWPRVYRVRRGLLFAVRLLAALVLLGGVAVALALLRAPRSPPALALALLALVAVGVYVAARVGTGCIRLWEDAVEVVELTRRRRLRRDEIVGLRVVPLQYGFKQLVFELRGGRKPFKLDWAYESDPTLDAWLGQFPDLDAQERAAAESELLRSRELGPDEAARSRALGRARTVGRMLNGVSVAAGVWGWVFPRPYPVAIAVLGILPLFGLALLALGRGRYAFDTSRTEPRPSLIVTVMVPGLVLAMRAIRDLRIVDVAPLLLGAAVGAVAIVALVAAFDRKARKPWVLLLLAPLLAFYPGGGAALANALLDRAPPQVFRVAVRGKHVSTGKYTSYDLTLDPWGPVEKAESVDVGRQLYDVVATGDVVCVALQPGALGLRWFVVLRCPPPRPQRSLP